jgi:hypothetical protein
MKTTTATTTMIATDDNDDDIGRDDDDDDDDDDDAVDDATSSNTMSNEGDNRNCDNGEDACTLRQCQRHWQRVLSCSRGQGSKIIPSFICSNNIILSYDLWLASFWN